MSDGGQLRSSFFRCLEGKSGSVILLPGWIPLRSPPPASKSVEPGAFGGDHVRMTSTGSTPSDATSRLASLTRKPDRAADRELLDALLDETKVGTLSTVVDGLPWSVPMLFARDGDSILLHGSTGAGALRHVAAGAPVTFTVFALDGLVVADTLFDHSANYRSVVVRGVLEVADDAQLALEVLSDKLIPGRVAEVRPTASITTSAPLPSVSSCTAAITSSTF